MKFCGQCNKQVKVSNEIIKNGQVEQILSCGHSRKDTARVLVETSPTSGEIVSAWSSYKTLTIEPLTTGTIPVNVSGVALSGETIPKTPGLLDTSKLYLHNEGSNIVANVTIYDYSTHTRNVDMSTNTVNNLKDIYISVDNSGLSEEEKLKVKEILSIVDKEKDKPRSEIKSKLNNLRPWIDTARPWIGMVFGLSF
jgi:hypothetical protein